MAWLLTIALPPGVEADELASQLWDFGTTGVAEIANGSTGTSVIAGFDDRGDADRAVAAIGLGAIVTPVDPDSWSVPEPQQLRVGDRWLTIEVDQAFGHGHHPTTRLALDAVVRLVSNNTRVLDVGTGTGILALAAAALGALSVVAIDIDPEAVAVARRNAARNRLDITIPDHPVLDEASGSFDLVVANMLAADLEPLAPRISRLMKPGGSLVVSGFLVCQRDWVHSMFDDLLVVEHVEGENEWARTIFAAGRDNV